jgi:hypothetical protein
MMAAGRMLACMGLGLLTCGCANLPVKPSADTLTVASGSPQGTRFDGVYQGTLQITSAAPRVPRNWCQPVGNRMIVRVTDDTINYTLTFANIGHTQTFSIPVDANGSFSGTGSMHDTMSGQVTGSQISGTIAGEGCNWAFSAQRS